MPFHMHINLEMVEAVYLTCATLLETPNIAAHPIASTRFVLSKPFLRLLETYRNQVRPLRPDDQPATAVPRRRAMQGVLFAARSAG